MAEVEELALMQSLGPLDPYDIAQGSLNQLSLSDDDQCSVSKTTKYKSPHQPNIEKHRSRRGRRRKVKYPNIPVLPVIGGIVLPSVTSILAEHYRQQAIDNHSVAQSCTPSIIGSTFEEEDSYYSLSPPHSPAAGSFRSPVTTAEVALERAKQKHQKIASRRKSATVYNTDAVLSFMRLERNSRKPDFSKFWNASWGKGGGKSDNASLTSGIDDTASDMEGNNQPQTPLQTPSRQKLPSQNNSQRSDSQIRSDAQNRSDVERSDAESRSKSPTPTSHHSAAQDPRQFVETSTDDSVLLLKKELTDYLNNVKRAFPSKLQQRQERSQKMQRVQQQQQQQQRKHVSYFPGTSNVDDDSLDGGGSVSLYHDDGSLHSLNSGSGAFIPGYSNSGSLDGSEFSIVRSASTAMSSSGRNKGPSRGNGSGKGSSKGQPR